MEKNFNNFPKKINSLKGSIIFQFFREKNTKQILNNQYIYKQYKYEFEDNSFYNLEGISNPLYPRCHDFMIR